MALEGSAWPPQRSGRFAPGKEISGPHCTGGWVVLGAGLSGSGKSRHHRGSTPDPPAPNESLYRIRAAVLMTNAHTESCQ